MRSDPDMASRVHGMAVASRICWACRQRASSGKARQTRAPRTLAGSLAFPGGLVQRAVAGDEGVTAAQHGGLQRCLPGSQKLRAACRPGRLDQGPARAPRAPGADRPTCGWSLNWPARGANSSSSSVARNSHQHITDGVHANPRHCFTRRAADRPAEPLWPRSQASTPGQQQALPTRGRVRGGPSGWHAGRLRRNAPGPAAHRGSAGPGRQS